MSTVSKSDPSYSVLITSHRGRGFNAGMLRDFVRTLDEQGTDDEVEIRYEKDYESSQLLSLSVRYIIKFYPADTAEETSSID